MLATIGAYLGASIVWLLVVALNVIAWSVEGGWVARVMSALVLLFAILTFPWSVL